MGGKDDGDNDGDDVLFAGIDDDDAFFLSGEPAPRNVSKNASSGLLPVAGEGEILPCVVVEASVVAETKTKKGSIVILLVNKIVYISHSGVSNNITTLLTKQHFF